MSTSVPYYSDSFSPFLLCLGRASFRGEQWVRIILASRCLRKGDKMRRRTNACFCWIWRFRCIETESGKDHPILHQGMYAHAAIIGKRRASPGFRTKLEIRWHMYVASPSSGLVGTDSKALIFPMKKRMPNNRRFVCDYDSSAFADTAMYGQG